MTKRAGFKPRIFQLQVRDLQSTLFKKSYNVQVKFQNGGIQNINNNNI